MKVFNNLNNRSLKNIKNQYSLTQTDIESSCCKSLQQNSLKTQPKINEKKPIQKKKQKTNKGPILHQKICRSRIQGSNKTVRIYMYKQCDMGWKKKFIKKLSLQQIDNDIESDSEMIENQVNRCSKNLLQVIDQRRNQKKGLNQ